LSSKKNKKRSFISELRHEDRINENFLNIVSDLKLEELIAVKLEQSARMTGGKFYNLPIWYTLPYICRDACFKFASSICNTKSDMASLLGIPYDTFVDIYKKYNNE
tara:strand:- start:1796 stop:2113 length:318 start_codon:yes stop_codon:yes gene_type:complete